MAPNTMNKNGAIVKIRILVEQVIKEGIKKFLMKCQFYFLSYVDDILVVCRCRYS